MRRSPRRQGGLLAIALAASWGAQLSLPAEVAAVDYNNTNPATTPCGDGSHPVETWQSRWVTNSSGLRIALVEVRRSDYCNTVWTRVTNETGRGTGYAPATTLTVTERIYAYSCPLTSCQAAYLYSTDTISKYGTSPYQGFTFQVVIPAGTNLGSPAAKQPPAFQGTGSVPYSGSTYTGSTGLQPVYTELNNAWDTGGAPLSCNNATNSECKWWGESGGSYVTIYARLDPNLSGALGGVDVGVDFADVVRPLWNVAAPHNPLVSMCSSCAEQILVQLAALPAGKCAQTKDDGNTLTLPEIMLHRIIQLSPAVTWDHHCGTSDASGCATDSPASFGCDSRVCISHEMGHAEGLGHCGFNFGVMCHVSNVVHGTAFWTPQPQDVLGLRTIYP